MDNKYSSHLQYDAFVADKHIMEGNSPLMIHFVMQTM